MKQVLLKFLPTFLYINLFIVLSFLAQTSHGLVDYQFSQLNEGHLSKTDQKEYLTIEACQKECTEGSCEATRFYVINKMPMFKFTCEKSSNLQKIKK